MSNGVMPMQASKEAMPEAAASAAHFIGEAVEGSGGWRYACVCAAPGGKLYAPPFNCERVLEIDPAAGTARPIGETFTKASSGTMQYLVMVAARNGRLYAPPCSAKRVLEVDPASGSVRLIGEDLPGGEMKYRTFVEAPDGRLYAPPYTAGRVLEVDPVAGSARLIGPELPGEGEKYLVAKLARNGRLYAPPCCCDQVLEIDPATSGVRLIGEPVPWRGWKRYVTLAEGPSNGKLYSPPCWGATHALEIDPEAGTARQIGEPINDLGEKYWAIAAASNGRLYAPPCDAAQVLEIDPCGADGGEPTTRFLPVCRDAPVGRRRKQETDEEYLGRWLDWDDTDWEFWYQEFDPWRPWRRQCGKAPPDGYPRGGGSPADKGRYWAIAAAPNGRLYAPPYNANRVLEIDGVAGTAREIGDEILEGMRKYQVITQGPAGKLYAPPGCCNWTIEVDSEAPAVRRVGPKVEGGNCKKYVSITAAISGSEDGPGSASCRLYAPPCLGLGQAVEVGPPLCTAAPCEASQLLRQSSMATGQSESAECGQELEPDSGVPAQCESPEKRRRPSSLEDTRPKIPRLEIEAEAGRDPRQEVY